MFVTFQTVPKGQTRRCRDVHPVTVKITSIICFRPTEMVTQVYLGDGNWEDAPLSKVVINKGDTSEEILVVGQYVYDRILERLRRVDYWE